MPFNINAFKANLKYGGARTSLFEVQITNPINGAADNVLPFLCEAAQLPGSTLNIIEQSYFGRPVKFSGNRTFEDWTITVINDEDFKIRNAMETWLNAINSPEGNIRGLVSSEHSLYKSEGIITQLSQNGTKLRVYKFSGIFPTNVSPIEMGWDSEQISKTQITFAIDSVKVVGGVTGTAGPV